LAHCSFGEILRRSGRLRTTVSMTLLRLLRKSLLELAALLLAIVVAAVLVQAFMDHVGIGWIPRRVWIGLGMFTAITFWGAVVQFRSSWKRPLFWLATAVLLAIHLLVYSMVLIREPDWKGSWFALVSFFEAAVLMSILQWLGFSFRPGRN
jgi:hypothetical protein